MKPSSNSRLLLGACSACALAWAAPASAGPPYLSDDPDPTPLGQYEIYLFGNGAASDAGVGGASGVDFNYGATPDLQLTATFPIAYEHPDGGDFTSGIGNIELAAKIRFLHQDSFGLDVAIFPRVLLPSGSDLGDHHAALLIPIWLGREGENWSSFGGGGCAINRGGDSQDFCIAGWAYNRRVSPNLQLGGELFHQTADTKNGADSTTLGVGAILDLNEHVHLLGYAGAGLQNRSETDRTSWYASTLFTF